MKKVSVIYSPIQWKGVFAQKLISPWEIILIIDDSHIIQDNSGLTEKEKDHLDYLDGKYILMQSPEVYINHSCDPNCYVKTIKNVRHVIAIKNINVGQEVVYDYAINGDYDRWVLCKCWNQVCRWKLDNNFRKLPIQKQKEYLPYVDQRFIKKYQDNYNQLLSL